MQELELALDRLDAWIENEGFRGWDPHDALNSSMLRRIAGDNRLIGMALVQCLRRSPVNLRPLLRVPKEHNPKAMGLFLASYAQKFASTRKDVYKREMLAFWDWLMNHASPGYAGPCWGYNFAWPNRAFSAPAGTPTIVNTAFVALSFLGAGDVLSGLEDLPRENPTVHADSHQGSSAEVRGRYVARSACDFILRDLNVFRPSHGEICFSYTPLDHRFVHNANVLGAWLLAAVYARTGENKLADSAKAAARFTVSRQRSDGSWPYGIAEHDQWVDNFHTGYVLVSLRRVGQHLGDDEFEAAARRGYEYWKERMFLSDVIPKYYPDRVFPIDIHCVAQAILTYLEFSDVDPLALKKAKQLSKWAIEHLQDARGFFHYQIHRLHRVRVPYMRWGQAWMQLALTKLVYHSCAADFLRAASASV